MKDQNSQFIDRRTFLKRATYSAPVLVSLGKILTPTNAMADATGGPEGPPGGFFSVNKRVKPSRPKR
ncbi:MAG: hypothetical protein U9O64_09530 [Campylobacterota bacterium]|nr:hypothetical protein [Campylobacterota bacterium]